MALDTYQELWNRVLLRCPSASSFLAKDWITNAFRQVAERRRWSWLLKFGQFVVPQQVVDGTCTVTNGSATVTGIGTAWTPELVGRQFRIGRGTPIYTISAVASATSLTLDAPFGSKTAVNTTYQIYQCYFTPPEDFHSFLSVWDPANSWQLHLNVTQPELNSMDAQRSNMGQVYCVVALNYSPVTGTTPGLPRYELWPHPTSEYCYPFMYEGRAADLQDPGAALPRYIRGDVLMELALADAARWPRPSTDKPNPYYNLRLAEMHQIRAERMLLQLELQDDNTYEYDLTYQSVTGMPFAAPYGDSAWVQSHAL